MSNDPWLVPVVILLLGLAVVVYLLPSIVASNRRHRERAPIFVLNLLLGWTLVGWVAALVWSLTSHVEATPTTKGFVQDVLERVAGEPPRTDEPAVWLRELGAAVAALQLHFAARGVYLAKSELWSYLEQHGVKDPTGLALLPDLAQLRALGPRIAPQPLTWAQSLAKATGWAEYRLLWHERAVALGRAWRWLMARATAGRTRARRRQD